MLEWRSPLDGLRSPLGVRRGVSILSLSAALLAAEASGLAWVTNDEAVSKYGSITIKDAGNPSNNYSGAPFDFEGGKLVHSRGSNAMELGADGLWKYAPHNLIFQSQTLNTTWTKTNVTVTEDQINAPNGTLTADKVEAASSTNTTFSQPALGAGINGIYAAIYIKQGSGATEANRFRIRNNTTATDIARGTFDYSTQAITYTTGSSGVTLTRDEDGWLLLAYEGSTGWSLGDQIVFYVGFDGTAETAGEFFYGWGALVCALPVLSKNYITDNLVTTTGAVYRPKIYRDPVTLLNPRYWPEPQAMNRNPWSDDLTNAAWVKVNATAAKTATGIGGLANSASTLTATAANGYARLDITAASSLGITSTFMKRRTGSGPVTMAQGEQTGSEIVTNGDFATDISSWTPGMLGAATAATWDATGKLAISRATGANYSFATQTLSLTVGKLYSITFTATTQVGCEIGSVIFPTAGDMLTGVTANNATRTFFFTATAATAYLTFFESTQSATGTVDNVSVKEIVETTLTLTSNWTRVNTPAATITNPSIIIKLATSGDAIDVQVVQNEAGGVVTSPIPTAGASVTRLADIVSIANTLWPNQDAAMAYYAKYVANFVDDALALQYCVFENANASNEYVRLQSTTQTSRTGRSLFSVRDSVGGTVNVESSTDNLVPSGAEFEVRATYDASGQAHSINGAAVIIGAVPATLPTCNTLYLGSGGPFALSHINGPLEIFAAAPRRVVNGDLPTWLAA